MGSACKTREEKPLKPTKGERKILEEMASCGGFLTKDYSQRYRLLDRDRNPIKKYPLSKIDGMVNKEFLIKEAGLITVADAYAN